MTHQEFDKRLDETIDRVYLYGMNGGLGYEKFEKELSPKEAKQAIRELFLEVVGESLSTDIYGSWTRRLNGSMLPLSDEVVITNKVKKQLRTTITGKEGGE